MIIEAARTWFANIGGNAVTITPEVARTGAANERLIGSTESPVEIIAKDDASQIKIQLPCRWGDLDGNINFTLTLDYVRFTVSGQVRAGQVIGPATAPVILGRRPGITRIYPPSDFSIHLTNLIQQTSIPLGLPMVELLSFMFRELTFQI